MATIIVVVAAGVGPGIVLAIVLSLIVHTRHGYRPVNLLLTSDAAGIWHARPLKSLAFAASGVMIYRFTHSMYYANADRMAEEIRRLTVQRNEGLRYFCVDISCVDDVDFTALQTLNTLQAELAEKNVELLFAHMLDDPGAHSRLQLVKAFGAKKVLATIEEVLTYTQSSVGKSAQSPASS
jgi:MFS superfamily sulfate permease-like transporter